MALGAVLASVSHRCALQMIGQSYRVVPDTSQEWVHL
jgi:hypothetical protein